MNFTPSCTIATAVKSMCNYCCKALDWIRILMPGPLKFGLRESKLRSCTYNLHTVTGRSETATLVYPLYGLTCKIVDISQHCESGIEQVDKSSSASDLYSEAAGFESRVFPWFYSASPIKCQDITLNQTTPAFIHILAYHSPSYSESYGQYRLKNYKSDFQL
jgi:hypothetical protein